VPVRAFIKDIAFHLPEKVLTNTALAAELGWPEAKIEAKTGIRERHIAADGETAQDLAVAAARNLFARGASPADVDYVLLCTQSPDYFLPTSACIVQDRLGLRQAVGALDFNLGCSGYVYGLGLAKGLIETGQARNLLLLTADTYSKFLHPRDRSVRTLFGDGATATLVQGAEDVAEELVGPFLFGTDGAGAPNLIVPAGGLRERRSEAGGSAGDERTRENLAMNGTEIFTFTLRVIPELVQSLLARAGETKDSVDLYVFHQANAYMLDHLRQKLDIPTEKFLVALDGVGNTVSSTIPIALRAAIDGGRLRSGHKVMLVGFGVGYSWGATFVRWR
jgi:3-oxoacyl-[acyl-carrier-protein] synthase-3